MKTKELVYQAIQSIKAHLLRTSLTMLIIAIGIMALVGILSAIDAIKSSITHQFSELGANTFSIIEKTETIKKRGIISRETIGSPVTYYQAKLFKELYQSSTSSSHPQQTPSNSNLFVSISLDISFNAKLRYLSKTTNPNIELKGVDENYLFVSGYELEKGRWFSATDANKDVHYAVIGKDVKSLLFPKEQAIGKKIWWGNHSYIIIGVLKSKGSSFGFGGDKVMFIPLKNARFINSSKSPSFNIQVKVSSPKMLTYAMEKARSVFRNIRKLSVSDEDNFSIEKSDVLANLVIDDLKKVTLGATFIAAIALIGAAIGLLNMMLVNVKERTREIGIRKAIGASSKNIQQQFLLESIFIGLSGGSIGILLGIIIGNLVALSMHTNFFIPWFWMSIAVLLCFIVGILSGYFPSKQAAQVDPIESLRYE